MLKLKAFVETMLKLDVRKKALFESMSKLNVRKKKCEIRLDIKKGYLLCTNICKECNLMCAQDRRNGGGIG